MKRAALLLVLLVAAAVAGADRFLAPALSLTTDDAELQEMPVGERVESAALVEDQDAAATAQWEAIEAKLETSSGGR